MALSPNSPDYIGEVRGVINDLRQNYLTKQQLFQQQQQAAAQNALGYAQLNAQRENAALDSDYKNKVLEQNAIQEQSKNDAILKKMDFDSRKDQFSMQKDAAALALDNKRYELSLDKEVNYSRKEADERAKKEASGTRMAKFMSLAAKKDYAGMQQWQLDAEKDVTDLASMKDEVDVAKAISDNIQAVSNFQLVKNAEPELNKFYTEAADLQSNLESLSPVERNQAIADLTKRSYIFKTQLRDKATTDGLDNTIVTLNGMKKAVEEKAQVQDMDSFNLEGEDRRLAKISPAIQNKFDDLYARTPEAEQNSAAFTREKRLLYLEFNQIRSSNELARRARNLADLEIAQMNNPEFTIVGEDGVKRPKFPAPDLTPSYENGTLDRNNNISPGIEAEYKAYVNKITIPGIAKQQKDPLAEMGAMMLSLEGAKGGKKPTPASPQASAPVDNTRMKISNTWALNQTPAPTTNTVPAVAPTTPVPPEAPATPEAPKADTADYLKNVALLDEINRQINAGNKTYMESGKPTKINLYTLKNRVQSRMGQRTVGTFNPPPDGMVSDFLTPPLGTEQPTGEVKE
jgi:hypothetical protein